MWREKHPGFDTTWLVNLNFYAKIVIHHSNVLVSLINHYQYLPCKNNLTKQSARHVSVDASWSVEAEHPACSSVSRCVCKSTRCENYKCNSFTCATHVCKHVSYINMCGWFALPCMRSSDGDAPVELAFGFLMSTNTQRERHWRQMSKFIFRFLEETADVTKRGHHCVLFSLWFCSSILSPVEARGLQAHTNTHRHTSRRAQTHFWPRFHPPPSSRYLRGV